MHNWFAICWRFRITLVFVTWSKFQILEWINEIEKESKLTWKKSTTTTKKIIQKGHIDRLMFLFCAQKCFDLDLSNEHTVTLMACGRSGSFMSLNCWGKFMLFNWCTTAAGAADRPASCLTKRFWSSMRASMSDIFVWSTIPPVQKVWIKNMWIESAKLLIQISFN